LGFQGAGTGLCRGDSVSPGGVAFARDRGTPARRTLKDTLQMLQWYERFTFIVLATANMPMILGCFTHHWRMVSAAGGLSACQGP